MSALPVTCLHARQSSFCNYIKEEHPNARTFLHAFGRSFYYCPVKRKNVNGLKHQTLPLMGATRLASGIVQLLFSGVSFLFIFPTRDASPPLELAFLQAPNAITKRYHPTRSQNANSNGGDASRVGKILRLLHTTFCHARATRQNGYTTRTSQLRGSGFAIRATEFPLPHYPHNIPYKHIYTTLLTLQTNADKRADRISLCLHFLTI